MGSGTVFFSPPFPRAVIREEVKTADPQLYG
jgi:hypothetical protein